MRRLFLLMVALPFIFSSCKKSSVTENTATFTLGGVGSDCTGATVSGTYQSGVSLSVSETVAITVTVTSIGSYNISTDTANGISFSSVGHFDSTGTQTVVLAGHGTPLTDDTENYSVNVNGSACTFSLTVGEIIPFGISCNLDGVYTTFNVSAFGSNTESDGFEGGGYALPASTNPQLAFGFSNNGSNHKVTVGTYTNTTHSVGFNYQNAAGIGYSPVYGSGNTFTFQVVYVSDSRIKGKFSGTMQRALSSEKIIITNGLFNVPLY